MPGGRKRPSMWCADKSPRISELLVIVVRSNRMALGGFPTPRAIVGSLNVSIVGKMDMTKATGDGRRTKGLRSLRAKGMRDKRPNEHSPPNGSKKRCTEGEKLSSSHQIHGFKSEDN